MVYKATNITGGHHPVVSQQGWNINQFTNQFTTTNLWTHQIYERIPTDNHKVRIYDHLWIYSWVIW